MPPTGAAAGHMRPPSAGGVANATQELFFMNIMDIHLPKLLQPHGDAFIVSYWLKVQDLEELLVIDRILVSKQANNFCPEKQVTSKMCGLLGISIDKREKWVGA